MKQMYRWNIFPHFHFGEVIGKQSSSGFLIHISIIFHRLFIPKPWEIFFLVEIMYWIFVLLIFQQSSCYLLSFEALLTDWYLQDINSSFIWRKIFLVCKWNVIEAAVLLKSYFCYRWYCTNFHLENHALKHSALLQLAEKRWPSVRCCLCDRREIGRSGTTTNYLRNRIMQLLEIRALIHIKYIKNSKQTMS